MCAISVASQHSKQTVVVNQYVRAGPCLEAAMDLLLTQGRISHQEINPALVVVVLNTNVVTENKIPMRYTNVKYLSIHDGDTLKLQYEITPRIFYIGSVRLANIDTQELNAPSMEARELAIKARTYLANQMTLGRKLEIEEHGIDKYGRPLVTLYTQNKTTMKWENINNKILEAGYARPIPLTTQLIPLDQL